jgi:hypothetical protein
MTALQLEGAGEEGILPSWTYLHLQCLKGKKKLKYSLYLIKHYAVKTYGGVEV